MKPARLLSSPQWWRTSLLALFACLFFVPAAQAHRLDEYLQATLVVIEPGEIRLQMDLTPGVTVAEAVLAQIDRNHDGAISAEEAAAYAVALEHDLTITLDANPLPLKLAASHFPEPAELREGAGIIQIEFAATPGAFAAGTHRLNIQNRHLPTMSVYLLNAGQPAFFAQKQAGNGSIEITAQKRNHNQAVGTIEFIFRSASAVPAPTPHAVSKAALTAAVMGVAMLAAWSLAKNRIRLPNRP